MTSGERRDPYLVLGVPRAASAAEIARAYRRAARVSHPDSSDAGSAERFRAVFDAYEELRDPRRRAMYDRSHPLARSRVVDSRGGSVRYAEPGSQHVVLGRPAPRAAARRQLLSDDVDEWSGRRRGDIEDLLRAAIWFLRAGW